MIPWFLDVALDVKKYINGFSLTLFLGELENKSYIHTTNPLCYTTEKNEPKLVLHNKKFNP